MPGVLKYKDGAVYTPLYGGSEEVTISPNQPPVPTDLWLDTDDDSSYPDNILSGFRNVIRNGDMDIAQRGNGPFSNGRSLDGYRLYNSGGTYTLSRVVVANNPTLMRNVVSGQTGLASDFAYFIHDIEDVRTLAGKQVTVSFTASAASGTPKIAISVDQEFGSGGSPLVTTVGGTVTLSTTLTRYSLTFTLPSVTGKTIGTGVPKIHLDIWLSAGTNNAVAAQGIGVQNNTFDITDIQLEAGAIATPFERLPIQQQLAWCQRYFQRWGTGNPNVDDAGGYFYAIGTVWSGYSSNFMFQLAVPMRTAPSSVVSAASSFVIYMTTGNLTPTAVSVSGATAHRLILSTTTAVIPTAAMPLYLKGSSVTDRMDLSAEL